MRREYELTGGRPNPYARRLGAGGRKAIAERYFNADHVVQLDDDVAGAFASGEAVNEALRLVVRLRALAAATPRQRAPGTRSRAKKGSSRKRSGAPQG